MSSKSTDLFKNLKLNAKKDQEEVVSINVEEEEFHDAFEEIKGTVTQSFNFENHENNGVATEASTHENNKVTTETSTLENTEVKEVKKETTSNEASAPLTDNRVNTGSARGITPEIDGEKLSIKRSYQYRESTLRKLNILKANHPDVNVYLNTIIDASINHYYDYIMNQGGKQK